MDAQPIKFQTLEEVKVRAVKRALLHFEGNKKRVAKALGISIRSVRNYVSRYPELHEFKVVWPIAIRLRCKGVVENNG